MELSFSPGALKLKVAISDSRVDAIHASVAIPQRRIDIVRFVTWECALIAAPTQDKAKVSGSVNNSHTVLHTVAARNIEIANVQVLLLSLEDPLLPKSVLLVRVL